MKIRGKLLQVLLIVALVPLGISAFLHYASMNRYGHHLAGAWRQSLTVSAHDHLASLIENFGLLQARNEETLELTLRIQAREIELQLRFPSHPERLAPVDMMKEKARLSEVFRYLEEFSPQQGIRRLIVLESGVDAVYPERTGYSNDDELRRKGWYQRVKGSRQTTWEVIPGVKGNAPTMIMAAPLRFGDGSFAGVIAVEVDLEGRLDALRLPAQWSEKSEKLLVVFEEAGSGEDGALRVVGREKEKRTESSAQEYLKADSRSEMDSILADVRAGRSGVRLLRYRGEASHWVYGVNTSGRPFPLIIVPHRVIIDQAENAKRHVHEETVAELKSAGLIFFGVTVAILIVTVVVARRVTRPLSQLADGAERLAAGNYQIRVEINTGDEFQEVGEVFNALGPKLRERERMARSLSIAGEIQKRLLPQAPPELPDFDIGAQSLSCEETGGDYYDFILLPGGRLGVAVGDVSGHGIGAALLMTAARGVLRSYAGLEMSDPATLFMALNRHLARDVSDQEFMTLFYAEIDLSDHHLWWNSAGHGPVYHYKGEEGELTELPPTGIPLGIVAEATWKPAGPVILGPGDILLIGTDGLWECRNLEGEMFGASRICEVFLTHATESAAEICAAIMEQVRDFRGNDSPEDDVTLVVVRRKRS